MTLNRRELFERWSPPGSPWADWAKPVFFALMHERSGPPNNAHLPSPDLRWLDHDPRPVAIILDLPGVESARWAASLAARGFATVPLFNGTPGPQAVIDYSDLARALVYYAPDAAPPPQDAPPCFLLDSDRLAGKLLIAPGQFDNRWLTFPHDFPSAALLMSRSLHIAIVVQLRDGPVSEDLSHVLLHWQRAGVAIMRKAALSVGPPERIEIRRPKGYRSALRRVMVTLGLRHNSAGGFGSKVPDLQDSSGVGYA
mgnify:CR=1 FL=1